MRRNVVTVTLETLNVDELRGVPKHAYQGHEGTLLLDYLSVMCLPCRC